MLLIIACAIFFTEVKDAIFTVKALWMKWQIRATVVVSVCVQLLLVILGNRRRYSRKRAVYTSLTVSLMYLLGDWIATVALNSLLKSSEEQLTSPLVVFWEPFLLLHLGGPDTTTAYSLSENDGWVKHFLGLCFQLGVALYVYLKFWTITITTLTYLAIPIFIVGIIKYGERVLVLFSASDAQLQKSVFKTPTISGIEDVLLRVDRQRVVVSLDDYLQGKGIHSKYRHLHRAYRHLHRAYLSFKMFGPLFLDLKLSMYKPLSYLFTLDDMPVEKTFELVEIELGFLYDLLHTKIPMVLSRNGVIRRSICSSFLFSILIAFSIIVGNHGYPKLDIAITYFLLLGAIFLEIYSAVLLVSSDRGIQWLTTKDNRLLKAIISSLVSVTKTNRSGIQSMAQNSLIDYCVKARSTKFRLVPRIFDTEDFEGKYRNTSWQDVKVELKNGIYTHLLEKRKKYEQEDLDYKYLLKLLDERGYDWLRKKGVEHDLGWSIDSVEFTHSLLLWHIATDILFHDDRRRRLVGDVGPYCNISKLLSDYMMYLLFTSPTMLPQDIIKIRLRDTCMEAMSFLHKDITRKEALEALPGLGTTSRSVLIQMGSEKKSVFFEGCRIAQTLCACASDFQWDHEEKWETIGRVWLEMLTYAASQCTWREHAKQLKQGEELLTRVALLMAHLGLSKNIQMVDIPKDLEEEGYQPRWDWDNLDRLAYYMV